MGEALIRVSRVEKTPKINKRASPFIRKVRVARYNKRAGWSVSKKNTKRAGRILHKKAVFNAFYSEKTYIKLNYAKYN